MNVRSSGQIVPSLTVLYIMHVAICQASQRDLASTLRYEGVLVVLVALLN